MSHDIAQALAGLANPALLDWPAAEWITPAELRRQHHQQAAQQRRAAQAGAADQLAEVWEARTVAPIHPYATDRDLAELARRRASLMVDRIAALHGLVTVEWLNAEIEPLEARPLELEPRGGPVDEQLQAMVKRVTCPIFWKRNLKRARVRKREAQAQAAGRVSVRRGQPYVTDVTADDYTRQQAANRAILEAVELESQDGEVCNLLAAFDASTANKAIRRGELMTRIRGCEEWATAAGMVGIFTTNTCPSRFHSQRFEGGANPRYAGEAEGNPRKAQEWLRGTWARTRAAFQRAGVQLFGFRVAEPHHDGCPHWHMLLWARPERLQALQTIMRAQWLKDGGDEPGAQQHRFKAERIDPAKGGAVAYVAKYIAKNIDDFGAVGEEGHRDEWGQQIELIEGGNKARRVMAWASAWGIRQFQAIGQPPVSVWRELRRVDAATVAGASEAMQAAHQAVNREGERRACWRTFLEAQGGAMTGRDYRLRLEQETEPRPGRYGTTYLPRPVGVADVKRPGELVLSKRKQWRPRGTWGQGEQRDARVGVFGAVRDWLFARPQAAQPWTRVINCTGRSRPGELMTLGIVGVKAREMKSGGFNREESSDGPDPNPRNHPGPGRGHHHQ